MGVVGPGVVTHANLVNGLRVKQLQKAPLNVNGFLSKCQNWSDTFVGDVVANLVQGPQSKRERRRRLVRTEARRLI